MTVTQRATFLENYLATYKNETYSNNGEHVKAWELDWINSTSARVQVTEQNKTTNQTVNDTETFVAFPTTQDSTDYVNAVNLTEYSIASTAFTGGPYQNVTGHAPQVYKVYYYLPAENEIHVIIQLDNLVAMQTGKTLS